MKRILLFMMVLALTMGTMAQNKVQTNLLKKSKDINTTVFNNLPTPELNHKAVNEEVDRIQVGTANDFRTVRREDTRAISYNPELDLICITFVLDPTTYGTNATDVGMFYSTDRGQNWTGPVVVIDNGDSYVIDYPSGIVFNPADNTNVENAYSVMQDIAHVGGDWGYKMFASMTLGGADQDIEVVHNPDNIEDGYWNQYGLTQIDQEVRCMSMLPQGDWSAYTSAELQPVFAEFNGSSFDWDYSTLIDMDLYQNSEDNIMAWIGGYRGFDGGLDMAWSDNGEIGYMYMVGVTNDNPSGYQPIIYKTTDAGDNWDLIELDLFTDEMQDFFEPYIIEATGGTMIPQFFETASVVDYHGDLQIFAAIASHSANVLVYGDSLGFGYTNDPGNLFNLTIDDDGLKEIIWIDSLNTENIDDADEGSYAGNGWNHRVSIAKNDFENEIFCTWLDTRNVADFTINAEPDIFGWSRNIYTGEQSETVCFTEGTLYEKFYYFTYGAERAIYNVDDDTYTIPYLQSVSPGEFASNGAADPITFNYITGIEFPAIGDYVGINEYDQLASFEVSQNQPNPFNGSTSIEITTEVASPVSIEITNIMGQTVKTIKAGTINGSQNIIITSESLEAGVYFYTVTVGSEKITKKMILK